MDYKMTEERIFEILTFDIFDIGIIAIVLGAMIVFTTWAVLGICKRLGVGISFKVMLPWKRR